jgi:hypothetical protein
MIHSRTFALSFLMPAIVVAAAAAVSASPGGAPRPSAAGAAAPALIVDQCIEVATKDTFDVDIFVSDVSQLLAWDLYYAFNSDVVEVIGKDVHRLLEVAPSSQVFDFSGPVPNATGLYHLAAADTGGAGAAENGSGLLATLTMRAKEKGVSWSALHKADVDGNGSFDIGPTLTALGPSHISDTNGDGYFDGAIRGGQIAVDQNCEKAAPTPTIAPGLIVVGSEPGTTPVVNVEPAETDSPSSSETQGGGAEETPTVTEGAGNPSPTGSETVLRGGNNDIGRPPRAGDSGSSLATWLVGLLAGSAGLGVVLTYLVYRTRRTA